MPPASHARDEQHSRHRRNYDACRSFAGAVAIIYNGLVDSAEQFEIQGDWEHAAQAYEQILDQDPTSIAALNRLGAIRVRQGQYKSGIELYDRAYNVNPR